MNGFIVGETTACQTFTVGGDSKRKSVNHWNIQRKSTLQIPFPRGQLSVFYALAKYRVVKITRSNSEVVL
jgi:hypothetical protein